MRRTLLILSLLGLPALPVAAQAPPGAFAMSGDSTLVDRVVAVVGDSVVLLTELEREYLLAREQGMDVDVEEVLDNLVNLQLVLQAAAQDSTLLPTQAEVNRRVEEHLERVRTSFPDEAALQQALAQEGMTLTSFRDQLRSDFRADLIRTMYLQRRSQSAPPVVVSEAEMRAFFEEHRNSAQLQERPELLTLHQVMIRTGASDAAWERARLLADSLRAEILRGADFDALAREHSEDPGSAEQGGDMGWIRRGEMVPEFEMAAFSLMDGALSNPIRTDYGYHLIRAERTRPGEKRVRHILVMPDMEPADLERTQALAEDVARRIREGESALALAQTHGDRELPREITVARGQESQQLPPEFVANLVGAQAGDVVGPFDVSYRGRAYSVVVRVAEVREAGELTFEDLRDTVRQILTQQKREEQMYRELRGKTHVEIRF